MRKYLAKYLAIMAAFAASLLITAQANALDISTILAGSDANSNIDAVGTFVIGVVVGLFAISVVRRALGK